MKIVAVYRNCSPQKKVRLFNLNFDDVITFFLLVLFSILAGCNTLNPDIANYIRMFESPNFAEGAYTDFVITIFAKSLGFSFAYFRLFQYVLGYCVLFNAIHRICTKRTFVLCNYFIILIMMDSTQTLNFLGMCFFFLALSFICQQRKYSVIKYYICIIIAGGFHLIFFFYSLFPIFLYFCKRKVGRELFLLCACIFACLSIFLNQSLLQHVFLSFLDFLDMEFYSDYLMSQTRFGHFIPISLHCMCLLLCFYMSKKNIEKSVLPSSTIIWVMCMLSIYAVFSFPLFRFQSSLNRITRNICLLPFICYTLCDFKSHSRRVLLHIALVSLAFLHGFFYTYSNYWYSIVIPFFSSNWLI